ncbi:hypothetical protein KFL_000350310 [Klebsormidium nitens]|uniref:Uncharacterized protein n=1 Tax=Klebsormidium nitens TaxID=105231 RepID=A0A1Y1HT00_KLENI|nr:hypothetical protein KFL_000350310 [Klebsormidium nitens]|eukprot:GAQ79677.1 hypothetical protein KFL_000350310 [Klebsormidium nitens]
MARSLVALTAILAVASCIASSEAAATAPQTVAFLHNVTTQTQQLQPTADSITLQTGVLLVIGQGPYRDIIVGLTNIIQTETDFLLSNKTEKPSSDSCPASLPYAAKAPGTGTLPAADQTSIYNAFRDFVRVQQTLLNTLINRAALFKTAPFIGEPMVTVLTQSQNSFDRLAFSLIDLCPTKATDLRVLAGGLSGTYKSAIENYAGLSLGGNRKLLNVAA